MKIYCLGDSLTTGCGVSGSDCWVRRVAAQTGFEMINAGLNVKHHITVPAVPKFTNFLIAGVVYTPAIA